MKNMSEPFSTSKALWQTQMADKQQGVNNKDYHLGWLSIALRATDQELASTKSHVKVNARYRSVSAAPQLIL